MTETETRYQRVAREQRERQEAREIRRKHLAKLAKRHPAYARELHRETYEDRLDDLGHSPD